MKNSHNSIAKKNSLIFKKAKKLNRHFYKEGIQTAKRYVKRCLTPLIIREIQFKTTVRYHMLEWLSSRRQEMSVIEDVEGKKPLCSTGGSIN